MKRLASWPPACEIPGCLHPGLPISSKRPLRLCAYHLGDRPLPPRRCGTTDPGCRVNAHKKRRALIRAHGRVCALCDYEFLESETPTLDHIIPVSEGGTNALANLQLACFFCNQRRHYPDYCGPVLRQAPPSVLPKRSVEQRMADRRRERARKERLRALRQVSA